MTAEPRTPARTRRRAELAPRLLAAAEVLLADGAAFAELTVDELLAAAGVARSTFYKTFDGKGDLLVCWLAQITDEIEDAAHAWWSLGADAVPGDLLDALAAATATYAPHATVLSAAYEAAPLDPAVRAEIAQLVTRGTAGLRHHIERGQHGGWIDPELPAGDAAAWIVAMQERAFQQLRRLGEDEVGRLMRAQADLIWHALYAHAPSRRAA